MEVLRDEEDGNSFKMLRPNLTSINIGIKEFENSDSPLSKFISQSTDKFFAQCFNTAFIFYGPIGAGKSYLLYKEGFLRQIILKAFSAAVDEDCSNDLYFEAFEVGFDKQTSTEKRISLIKSKNGKSFISSLNIRHFKAFIYRGF